MITIPFFVITLLLIVSMCLFLIIRNVRNRVFLWVFIPLMLLATGTTYFMVADLMSQPTPYSSVSTEFQYLSHRVVGDQIYVWVMIKGQNRPWTLVMPKTAKAEEDLAKALQATKQGHTILGKPGAKGQGLEGTPGMESPFVFYDFAEKFYDLKNADRH